MKQKAETKTGEKLENNVNNEIIVDMEKYKKNFFNDETVRSLLKSEEDIEKGRTREAHEVIKELKEKYGF